MSIAARERRSSQAPPVRLSPHLANGPGPAPRLGKGPGTPRIPKQGKLRADRRGPDPHRRPGPPAPVRTPTQCRGPEPPRVPEAWDRAQAFRRKTRPPTAFNAMDKACSAAAVHKTAFCQAPLRAAYYQEAQWSRLSRARAEPGCCIKWIRQHGTFPSCRLRRKLHHPLKLCGGRCQLATTGPT